MLKFYYSGAPNRTKVALFLEEAELPYVGASSPGRHAKHSASSARRRSYGASNSNGRGNGGNRRSCGCNISALGDKGEAASSLKRPRRRPRRLQQ